MNSIAYLYRKRRHTLLKIRACIPDAKGESTRFHENLNVPVRLISALIQSSRIQGTNDSPYPKTSVYMYLIRDWVIHTENSILHALSFIVGDKIALTGE